MTAIMPLRSIAEEWQTILNEIAEAEGELTPEMATRLDTVQDNFDHKIQNIRNFVGNLIDTAKAEKNIADDFAARARAKAAKADWLKTYLKNYMELMGRDRGGTTLGSARIQKNSRPSIRWTGDIHKCPVEFIRVTVDLDGTKSYDHWKGSGTDDTSRSMPEGFQVERGTHLRLS